MTPASSLIDVARGKSARLSSSIDGPHAPLSVTLGPKHSESFFFHTALEERPSLTVDLEIVYALAEIVLYNRGDQCQDRSRTLRIECSVEGENWQLLHAGLSVFGGVATNAPMRLDFQSRAIGRYVRFSLECADYFHLGGIEIYAETEKFLLSNICSHYGLLYPELFRRNEEEVQGFPYQLELSNASDLLAAVSAIRISYAGRLGNYIFQLMDAIFVANLLGVKTLYLPESSLLNVTHQVEFGGMLLQPDTPHQAIPGKTFSGFFFGIDNCFRPDVAEALIPERVRIARECLGPLLEENIGVIPPEPDLITVVHFRAGDIFETHGGNTSYTQPPLSFYMKVVEDLRTADELGRVVIMAENRLNPTMEPFITFLKESGMEYEQQIGSLHDDVRMLMRAKTIVSSFGTFCLSIALFSKNIERFVYFRQSALAVFAQFMTVRAMKYVDLGDYIPQDGWHFTPDQVQTMLKYPISSIALAAD